jgi:hypothetical protein
MHGNLRRPAVSPTRMRIDPAPWNGSDNSFPPAGGQGSWSRTEPRTFFSRWLPTWSPSRAYQESGWIPRRPGRCKGALDAIVAPPRPTASAPRRPRVRQNLHEASLYAPPGSSPSNPVAAGLRGVYALVVWGFGRHRGTPESLDSCVFARLGATPDGGCSTLVMRGTIQVRWLHPSDRDRPLAGSPIRPPRSAYHAGGRGRSRLASLRKTRALRRDVFVVFSLQSVGEGLSGRTLVAIPLYATRFR